jgi:hypothetical protein
MPEPVHQDSDNRHPHSQMLNHTFLATLASIFCSIFIIAIITNVVIDPYIEAACFEENLLNFYEENNESNKIYIIGDSLPQWGIDPIIIDDYLQKNSQPFKVYNFAFQGDFPTNRIAELSYIVKSKPKIVVYCPQYYTFSEYYSPDYTYIENRFVLSANRIVLDPYTISLLDRKELSLVQMDFLHSLAYKRMLLVPSLRLTLSKTQLSGVQSIKPFLTEQPPLFGLGFTPNFKVGFIPPKIAELNQTPYSIPRIIETSSVQKKAFMHMIDVLKSQGITVIIITMPYTSELLRSFSNESRTKYSNFINQTQCHHYDLLSYIPDVEFYNQNHLNLYGRQNASKRVEEILLSEVRNVTK